MERHVDRYPSNRRSFHPGDDRRKDGTDQTYRGKWVAIFFGYTFCPDACPTALSNMSIAPEKLGNDAEKFQPLFITVDPDRDTSEVMSAFLDSFDRRIIGLSGTRAQIDAAAKTYVPSISCTRSRATTTPSTTAHISISWTRTANSRTWSKALRRANRWPTR